MNIIALLAGLFSGTLGAMGLGGGSVLIIYLSLFTDTLPRAAAGINLIFFIPIAALSVIIYALKHQIKWKTVIPFWIGGALGVGAGLALGGFLSDELMGKIFGGFIAILGAKEILAVFFKKKNS